MAAQDHIAASTAWMIDDVSRCEWFTKRDREEVCRLLYSNDVGKQKRGIARLAAWRARSHPRVALGFEVTASLLVALMSTDVDKATGQPLESFTDAETTRLKLAMAIVRFVNLVAETGQVMSYALTVSSIAIKMGVPEWIVDIRHSCSHSVLPSTRVLVSAAEFALRWTKTNFWEADDPLDVRATFGTDDRVSRQLPSYFTRKKMASRLMKAQLITLEKYKRERRINRHVTLNECDLEHLKENEIDELVDILIEDGLLLASRDKVFDEFFGADVGVVVVQLLDFWMPVLENLFQRQDVFPSTVRALVLAATTPVATRRTRLALEWLLVILERFLAEVTTSDDSFALRSVRDALLVRARPGNGGVNRNAVQLISRLKEIKLKRSLEEPSFNPSSSEPTRLVDNCGAWQFCSGRCWSNFAVGIDKDDAINWFPDKLKINYNENDG